MLEKLIEQQLAVDQAIEKKLDRSPDVMSRPQSRPPRNPRPRLRRADRRRPVNPHPEEARDDYYTKKPPLFAERRIYNIQEIVVPEAAGLAAPLRDMIAAGKLMEEIAKWLRGRTSVRRQRRHAPTRQIPLELLPQVAALRTARGLVLENGGSLTVMRLVASPSPAGQRRTGPAAHPMFLANQRAGKPPPRK